jgi:hypothetical protein
MRLDVPSRNAALDAVNALINDGAGTARLQLWSGPRPATLGGAPSGTLLANLPLTMSTSGPFGAASGGSANTVDQGSTVGLADGTVGWVRVLSRQQTARADSLSVGTSGSVEFLLNTLTVSDGATVTVLSWTRTMPAE